MDFYCALLAVMVLACCVVFGFFLVSQRNLPVQFPAYLHLVFVFMWHVQE